jgi:hypothetical protein
MAIGGATTVSGTLNITSTTGTHTFTGGATISGGIWNVTVAEPVTMGGNLTNNGTFTSGTGAYTFNSATAVQSISGTPTFANLTINNTGGGISASTNVTVTTTLTLTAGIVNAGANTIILTNTAAAALAGGSATSYVIGCLRKSFAAAGTLNFRAAGLDEFPVGIAGAYLPIEFTAGTTSTAGSVTACVTSGDDPNMTTTSGGGINTAKSVNRYWSLTTSGINTSAALVNAIFKFPNGATEYDAGANTANFVIERWDGSVWHPTTLVAANATSTQAQSLDITSVTNEFEVGELLSGVTGGSGAALGTFNAFDTGGPAGQVIGFIQTKQSGTAFNLRIVRIANNAVDTTFNTAGVQVQLMDASNNTGGFTTGCRSTWTTQIATTNVNFAAGIATAGFTIPNAWRDVRVRIGAGAGCSTDRFAVRPTGFTIAVTDATLSTAGTARSLNNTTNFACGSAGVAHRAGQPFTITATISPNSITTQYDGNITVGAAAGSLQCRTDYGLSSCATGALALGTWSTTVTNPGPAQIVTRATATTTYMEAGSFNLLLEDVDFASVDANDGTSLANRTVQQTGGAVAVGRFAPDHFKFVSPSTPQLQTFGAACAAARSFTYIGQPFWFVTAPSATLQAVSADDTTITTNYRGPLFKLTNAGVVESYTGNGPGITFGSSVNPPVLTQPAPPGNGTAAYSANAAAANVYLAFTRSTSSPIPGANAPFAANVALSVAAAEAGNCEVGATIGTPTPLLFNGGGTGIAFDGVAFTPVTPNIANGKAFVYGTMTLGNALGSELLDLPMPLETKFWTGTAVVRNTADNCTTISLANVTFPAYVPALTAANMPPGNVSGTGVFTGGVGDLKVKKPSTAAQGAADVSIGLAAEAKTWLQLLRTNPPGTYTQDPQGRAAFGLYGGSRSVIFRRERY